MNEVPLPAARISSRFISHYHPIGKVIPIGSLVGSLIELGFQRGKEARGSLTYSEWIIRVVSKGPLFILGILLWGNGWSLPLHENPLTVT